MTVPPFAEGVTNSSAVREELQSRRWMEAFFTLTNMNNYKRVNLAKT